MVPRIGPPEVDQCYSASDLFLLVLLDVFIDLVREFEVAIDIAAVGIAGVGKDGKFLFSLPLEDAFAAGRIVVTALDLAESGRRLRG